MKSVCILLGSPRKNGNTNSLVIPFAREAGRQGCAVRSYDLYEMRLEPCVACRCCQRDWNAFGCSREDDMQTIFDAVLESDLLVLASPIYAWYCTPPMKAVLDRLVYGMNKYYGEKKGPSLWEGEGVCVITTCGYPPEKGADLFAEGVRRYCRHSRLRYLGMLAERHRGYGTVFMDQEKEERAAVFARTVLSALDSP